MHLAICDDNPVDLEHLESLARQYGQAQSLELEITTCTGVAAYIEAGIQPDVLLLDIYMTRGTADGLTLARELRTRGYENPIILVTSSRDHLADGFEVGALHYLVKPVDEAGFAEAMRRARRQIKDAARSITVTSNRRQKTVPVNSILYVEVLAHQTSLVTKAGPVPVSMTLAETVELIDDEEQFAQCFRSYVVNIEHIENIEKGNITLSNGDKIPVSRREAASIEARFINRMFSKGETN